MSSSSVSFRISRHTQDLAETVHALSQRLVTLEQRLLALEGQLQTVRDQPKQAEASEAANLAPIEANIARLLQDCRQLLSDQPHGRSPEASGSSLADAVGESGTVDDNDAAWVAGSQDSEPVADQGRDAEPYAALNAA